MWHREMVRMDGLEGQGAEGLIRSGSLWKGYTETLPTYLKSKNSEAVNRQNGLVCIVSYIL